MKPINRTKALNEGDRILSLFGKVDAACQMFCPETGRDVLVAVCPKQAYIWVIDHEGNTQNAMADSENILAQEYIDNYRHVMPLRNKR